jgi:hypothetical protein
MLFHDGPLLGFRLSAPSGQETPNRLTAANPGSFESNLAYPGRGEKGILEAFFKRWGRASRARDEKNLANLYLIDIIFILY